MSTFMGHTTESWELIYGLYVQREKKEPDSLRDLIDFWHGVRKIQPNDILMLGLEFIRIKSSGMSFDLVRSLIEEAIEHYYPTGRK